MNLAENPDTGVTMVTMAVCLGVRKLTKAIPVQIHLLPGGWHRHHRQYHDIVYLYRHPQLWAATGHWPTAVRPRQPCQHCKVCAAKRAHVRRISCPGGWHISVGPLG